MRLFEFFLVIVLAEVAKHHCCAAEQVWIDARRFRPQLRGHVSIDEDGPANDAMLAHQVFDRADFLFFVFVAFYGGPNNLRVGPCEHESCTCDDDQTAAAVVEFDHLRLLL